MTSSVPRASGDGAFVVPEPESSDWWVGSVRAKQGAPIYTHHFEAGSPGEILTAIEDSLDLSQCDWIEITFHWERP